MRQSSFEHHVQTFHACSFDAFSHMLHQADRSCVSDVGLVLTKAAAAGG